MVESKRKQPAELRSHRWFGKGPLSFGRRSRMLQNGWGIEEFVGRPVIAIINTWSDLNTCHGNLKERAESVKRGVLHAGGFPVELPAMSLSERNVAPTTMLYRNFLAMETEELIRCHPVDGAVLLGGCDKTTPALLMGATSAPEAAPGTIRGDWGLSGRLNLVHGSDSPASARREIGLLFAPDELVEYDASRDDWVYGPW